MIPEIHPVPFGLRPPAKPVAAAVAAVNAAANRPSMEDIHAFAADMRKRHPPGGYAAAPASLPGLGGHLDLYDSLEKPAMGRSGGGKPPENMFRSLGEEFNQGLSTLEPLQTPHDFPYLKPLAGENLGNRLNTLI
jgi:hypothetical protein